MNDKPNLAKDTYSNWQKEILIGAFIIIILSAFTLYKIKDTPTFQNFLKNYTEYYNHEDNNYIGSLYSLLNYYLDGGNKKETIGTITLTTSDNKVFLHINEFNQGTTILLNSLKEIKMTKSNNTYTINISDLQDLEDKLVLKRDRSIIEKILNISIFDRKNLQRLEVKDFDKAQFKSKMEKVRAKQGFISKFVFGDAAALGEAELSKQKSRKKINNSYKEEIKSDTNIVIKDKNDTVNFQDKIKEIKQKRIDKKKKKKEKRENKNKVNIKKYSNTKYGSEYEETMKEINEVKEQVPENKNKFRFK